MKSGIESRTQIVILNGEFSRRLADVGDVAPVDGIAAPAVGDDQEAANRPDGIPESLDPRVPLSSEVFPPAQRWRVLFYFESRRTAEPGLPFSRVASHLTPSDQDDVPRWR